MSENSICGEGAPRVLCSDDNPVHRELARVFFERAGCAIFMVEDGKSALEALQSGAFDLVVLDLRMPRMDGFTAAKAIRALAAPVCLVPIVALSAERPEDVANAAIEAGFDEVLTKPVMFEDVTALIQKWTNPGQTASLSA